MLMSQQAKKAEKSRKRYGNVYALFTILIMLHQHVKALLVE
jgi:hypothetical protein